MRKQIEYSLANPVFDPKRQINSSYGWFEERDLSVMLTCNIGLEWTRYADGRPLWQISLCWWERGHRLPVLSWSPTKWRKAEAIRNKIMRGVGTDEPWIVEEMTKQLGNAAYAVHYRRPLKIDEVARMGQTPEVKTRPGRG